MTWLAHRITDTLHDWWSDPAYRDTVALTLAGTAACGLILLWLHILGG